MTFLGVRLNVAKCMEKKWTPTFLVNLPDFGKNEEQICLVPPFPRLPWKIVGFCLFLSWLGNRRARRRRKKIQVAISVDTTDFSPPPPSLLWSRYDEVLPPKPLAKHLCFSSTHSPPPPKKNRHLLLLPLDFLTVHHKFREITRREFNTFNFGLCIVREVKKNKEQFFCSLLWNPLHFFSQYLLFGRQHLLASFFLFLLLFPCSKPSIRNEKERVESGLECFVQKKGEKMRRCLIINNKPVDNKLPYKLPTAPYSWRLRTY